MKKVQKSAENGPFFQLDKLHQDAVIMLFNDDLTDEQIAKNVHRSPRTLYMWKKDPLFKAAQEQYSRLVVKNYKNDALKKIHDLLNAKSEMVQLQSATTILKMAGYLSDNSTPELDEAKVRKAKADAELSELKAKTLKGDNDDHVTINFIRKRGEDED
nr:phBC6A51 family helix-turn-helix protein [uncultured Ligilactobacillus sp.]